MVVRSSASTTSPSNTAAAWSIHSCSAPGCTAGTMWVRTRVPTPARWAVQSGADQEWIEQAAAVFDGEVVLAEDLTTIELAPTGH